MRTLEDFFLQHPKTALAFSGGVDSSFLLYAAQKYAKEVRAYYVKSEFQPQFEFDDALRLAEELGTDLKVIRLKILDTAAVKANPSTRCYYCKKQIFRAIAEAAAEDGFTVLMDGTNASDDEDDRPGMRALKEMSVLSPLRDCGLTKEQIRRLSKEAGLFTWEKPAYACLATRIASGEEITKEKLKAVEAAESFLAGLGFSDHRVRSIGGHARIEIPSGQEMLLLKHREEIVHAMKPDFKTVSWNLEMR